MGNKVFFTADDGANGRELWTSDGTAAGTTLAKDIYPGTGSNPPRQLTAVGHELFFTAYEATHGRELWKSDGTAAGTTLVKDITPTNSIYDNGPASLAAMGNRLFFSADDDTHGEELWTSDGTQAGTTLVKDTNPGPDSGYPGAGTALGGVLFFSANDGTHGDELWTSDGTEAGTAMVQDINPATGYYGGSAPRDLTAVGGTLFFTADDGTHGEELWRTVTVAPPVDDTAPDTTITSGPGEGATVTASSVTFGFAGTPGDTAKLQCRLDAAAFTDCVSPHTFTGLGDGTHTAAFRAVDAAGNIDPTPAQRSFTVQTTQNTPPPQSTPPPPSNVFTLPARGKPNTKNGSLTLSIRLPGPGAMSVQSAGKALIKPVTATVSSPGSTKVTLKPSKAGKKTLKAKAAKARKAAKVKVKVNATYTPTGGTGNTQTRTYTLLLKK